MVYKNFIFDMGNVILDFSPDYLFSQHTSDVEVISVLKNELFYKGLWHKMDNGDMSLDEMYSIVIQNVPQSMHQILYDYLNSWSLNMRSKSDMIRILEILKLKGFGIYLCSNAPSFFKTYNEIYPVLNMFDGIIFSGDIGISKPDPRIFHHLLEKYNLQASECFFVDDLSSNIEAGMKAGIDGYQFNGNSKIFEEFLKNILVL